MATLVGELVVLSGPFKGRRVPLSKERITIGREATCDVSLEDEATSRRHSEILIRNGSLFLNDLNSTNGTYLNDARLTAEQALKNGDRVGIGDTVFLLEINTGSSRFLPQVVFSEDRKGATTRLTLSLDETRFLELKEGTTIPDAQRHFALLYEFMLAISGVLHRPALLERVLDILIRSFKADRGVVMLLEPSGEPGTKMIRVREGLEANEDIRISRITAQEILQKKESFLSVDAETDERLAHSESIHSMRVHSLMGVPLKLKDRILGLVYLDKMAGSEPFSEMDLRLCTAMALQTAVCLENTALYSELLNAAEFNNSLLRSLSSGLMVMDLKGAVMRVNKAALEILRKEEGALVGKALSALPELSELNAVVQAVLASGKPEDRYEIRVRVGDESLPLGLSASVVADHSGKPVGVVANFRNLAQIRKLEEQVRRTQHLASLGQMAAGVAHEIRNPLNSIRGFTQLIQEAAAKESSNPKNAEYTQIVLEEVDRMNRIVQDLLDFSRQRELTLAPLRLEDTLARLAREMEPEFKAARIALKLDLPAEPPPGVLGNEDKLLQVWRNIVLNALQASQPEGEVVLRLQPVESQILQKREDGVSEPVKRRELAVSVVDQGVGIDPSIMGKIFDPFFTQKDVGTGLGLAISQKIVDQLGGRIEVQSAPGKGSTFTVFLPAV